MDREDYRVIRPAHPIEHAALREDRFGAQLSVDKAMTVELAFAWWLAARSPHSLVYLPLRSGASSSCGARDGDRKLDLVLLHHSLRFPVSRWKRLRARVSAPGAYQAHKVTLPPKPFPRRSREQHLRKFQGGFRDHLRWTVAADTLFVVGSRPAYDLQADGIRALAEDGPAHLAAAPDEHCCAVVGLGRWKAPAPDRRNPYSELHIECCPRHW